MAHAEPSTAKSRIAGVLFILIALAVAYVAIVPPTGTKAEPPTAAVAARQL